MADALVSPILEMLINIGAQQVQEEVNLEVGVEKQVDKLKSNLIDIQSVLEDAERKQVKDKAVRVWLDKLKDVCYDMDDVLDEWSTPILTWEMDEENTRSLKKMRCSFMRSPCFCLNQGVRRREIALKIKAISEKLDEIAKEKAMYGFKLDKGADHELPRLTTTSLVDESRSSGIGKTTLAQLPFNDAKVKTHFEKRIWVCVSEPFDEVGIAKDILEQLKESKPNLAGLQSLLQSVSQSIKGVRVLLVLDDVWTEDHRQWEQLKQSLAGCARGSKILVTTRKVVVAAMMGTDDQINIGRLSDDVCRSIFNHVAFYKRSKEERERLTDIGNKIADKCKGLPLAAKVLGVDENNLGEASVETSIGRVRHLSMMLPWETSFPSSIHRAKGLRSLLIGNNKDPRLGAALPDVMKQLTCIRSLNVSGSSIKEIPKEVGKLIHLRHLNLKGCEQLVSLPETMCDLCNLQSLDVNWCRSLKELPRATVN
ncbi:hypothetical protein DKX38_018944 [Salix brachista]|uniref:Rx N-terminal domain-containing protein n=1 Tax=Salix brachista TaxID=2182728 RepID=A0A5N5KPE7_9ROSI|nr:hypothetical protein DKX38_018944 [Salix brachista]